MWQMCGLRDCHLSGLGKSGEHKSATLLRLVGTTQLQRPQKCLVCAEAWSGQRAHLARSQDRWVSCGAEDRVRVPAPRMEQVGGGNSVRAACSVSFVQKQSSRGSLVRSQDDDRARPNRDHSVGRGALGGGGQPVADGAGARCCLRSACCPLACSDHFWAFVPALDLVGRQNVKLE